MVLNTFLVTIHLMIDSFNVELPRKETCLHRRSLNVNTCMSLILQNKRNYLRRVYEFQQQMFELELSKKIDTNQKQAEIVLWCNVTP